MVPAKIGDVKLVEVGATEGAIRRLAERQIFGILAKKLHLPVWPYPVYTIGCVSGHVEVAFGVERHAVGNAIEPFGVDFRDASTAITTDFNAEHPVQVAFHNVQKRLRGVERKTVGKMKWSPRKCTGAAIVRNPVDHAVGLLPITGIAEIQIALGIEHTEIRIYQSRSANGIRYGLNGAARSNPQDRMIPTVARIDIAVWIERDSETETAGHSNGVCLLSIR